MSSCPSPDMGDRRELTADGSSPRFTFSLESHATFIAIEMIFDISTDL